MKTLRVLALAGLGYAAMLVPSISQARSVELSLPGISVRLPAPPLPILVPPGVTIREVGGGYDRGEYRRVPAAPRYYREDWRRERWEDHRRDARWDDRHDDRHDDRREHGGWRR
jgi:hypothetical protein